MAFPINRVPSVAEMVAELKKFATANRRQNDATALKRARWCLEQMLLGERQDIALALEIIPLERRLLAGGTPDYLEHILARAVALRTKHVARCMDEYLGEHLPPPNGE